MNYPKNNKGLIIFSHGKKGSPNGIKIGELSKIAHEFNYKTLSIDYRNCKNADERIEKLEQNIKENKSINLILVGSSMGGYISTVVAKKFKLKALFLMCPAFYLKGYTHQNFKPITNNIFIIHGNEDETVPFQNSVSFTKKFNSKLLLVKDNHRLSKSIEAIKNEFINLLKSI